MEFQIDLFEKLSAWIDFFGRAKTLKLHEWACRKRFSRDLLSQGAERWAWRRRVSESFNDADPALRQVERQWCCAGPSFKHPFNNSIQLLHHSLLLVRHSDQLRPKQRADLPWVHSQVALLSKLRHDVQDTLWKYNFNVNVYVQYVSDIVV